jgi:mannose-6-phosphate isomerase
LRTLQRLDAGTQTGVRYPTLSERQMELSENAGPRITASMKPGAVHRERDHGSARTSTCDYLRVLPADGSPLPRRIPKPWGYEIWYALTDRYAGKILHVEEGHRLSVQYHQHKDESCYLLSGRLLLLHGPDVDHLAEREITPGSVWRNQPGDIHTIQALEDSDVLEVSTPELDDVIRLKDRYGREGTRHP